jgi:bla regulator protein blaR1
MAANGGDLLARVRRLLRPDAQSLNWAAALPVLVLAAACLGVYAKAAVHTPAMDGLIVDSPPMVIFTSCAKPVYPPSDLAAGHTGSVTLGMEVSAEGHVVASRISRSSGYPSLDAAAHDGITQCSFKPALYKGKPVQTWTAVQYVWRS